MWETITHEIKKNNEMESNSNLHIEPPVIIDFNQKLTLPDVAEIPQTKLTREELLEGLCPKKERKKIFRGIIGFSAKRVKSKKCANIKKTCHRSRPFCTESESPPSSPQGANRADEKFEVRFLFLTL